MDESIVNEPGSTESCCGWGMIDGTVAQPTLKPAMPNRKTNSIVYFLQLAVINMLSVTFYGSRVALNLLMIRTKIIMQTIPVTGARMASVV